MDTGWTWILGQLCLFERVIARIRNELKIIVKKICKVWVHGLVPLRLLLSTLEIFLFENIRFYFKIIHFISKGFDGFMLI